MDFEWSFGIGGSVYEDALDIRKNVFVVEQSVPEELEIDELENECHYVVGYINTIPVTTARLYVTSDNYVKVQRVAVSQTYRGKHLGNQLMKEVEKYAKSELCATILKLGAQQYAVPFYEKLGYTVYSDSYLDAGIWHKDMYKDLTV